MSLAPIQSGAHSNPNNPNAPFTLTNYYDRHSTALEPPEPEGERPLDDRSNGPYFYRQREQALGYGYPAAMAGPSRTGGSSFSAAQGSTQNLLEPQSQFRSISGQTLRLHNAQDGSGMHDMTGITYPPLPPESAFQPQPSHVSYADPQDSFAEDEEEKIRRSELQEEHSEVLDQRWRLWHRYIFPSSVACRLLLITVLLETCIDIAIEANILWRFNQEVTSNGATEIEQQNKRRLPVYLCIFGLAHLWQLVLTMDAIRTRNTIQVIALAIFNGMFLIYAGIEISEIRTILGTTTPATSDDPNLLTLPLNVLTALVIAIIATSELIVIGLTLSIYKEFGVKNWRFLGADLQIKKYYFHYQIFDCICRFSAFFFAAFGIQFIFLVLKTTDPEFVITCIMFPLTLVFLLIGILAARHEHKVFMGFFQFLLVAGCAYFTFKLVRIWQFSTTTYAMIEKSLTAFAALSIVMLILCFVAGLVVWSHFGKGLKQHIIVRHEKANINYRMTID